MSFQYRNLKITDAEALANLSQQLGYPAVPDAAQRRIAAVLEHPDHCTFAAVIGEHLVGWIHGFYTVNLESDPFVAIAGLVVDEKYRRKGIGKVLIEQVIDWTVSKKCGRVRVRCNAVRKESHRFYEALGFSEVKEQKVFDMRLDLSAYV